MNVRPAVGRLVTAATLAAATAGALVLATPAADAATPQPTYTAPGGNYGFNGPEHPFQVPSFTATDACTGLGFPTQLPTAEYNNGGGTAEVLVSLSGGHLGSFPLLGSATVYWFNFATFRGGQATTGVEIEDPLQGASSGVAALDTGPGLVAMSVVLNVSGAASGGAACGTTPALGLFTVD